MKITINKDNARTIIEAYYRKYENADATVKFSSYVDSDRMSGTAITNIEVSKKVELAGTTNTSKEYINNAKLGTIFKTMLQDDGYVVESVKSVTTTEYRTKGSYMSERTESYAKFGGIEIVAQQAIKQQSEDDQIGDEEQTKRIGM